MKLSSVVLTGTAGLLSLALAACGGGSTGSGSAGGGTTTVFKLAFNQTEDHPEYVAGVELGKKLEEATDGRYSIRVYPNDQLGGQADVIQNLSNGTVEMMWTVHPSSRGSTPTSWCSTCRTCSTPLKPRPRCCRTLIC